MYRETKQQPSRNQTSSSFISLLFLVWQKALSFTMSSPPFILLESEYEDIQREVPPEYRCDGLKFRVNIFAQLATVAQAPQVCEYRAHIQQRQQFIMHSGTGGGKLYLILPRSYHIARCCHPQFACNLLSSLYTVCILYEVRNQLCQPDVSL